MEGRKEGKGVLGNLINIVAPVTLGKACRCCCKLEVVFNTFLLVL